MNTESELTECEKRWRMLESVIRKFWQPLWQTLRWLIPPLIRPTPGAWIVNAMDFRRCITD